MNAALKKNIDEVLKLAFKEDSTKKDIEKEAEDIDEDIVESTY